MSTDLNRISGMLSDAWFLAERQHRNQRDLRGRPYMLHPLEVAADVTRHGWRVVVVALLHDFYEDGGTGDLEDFTPEIGAAVDAITRLEGEQYMDYITRVSRNQLATLVKIADLRRNLATCPRASLRERYEAALRRLEPMESEWNALEGTPS